MNHKRKRKTETKTTTETHRREQVTPVSCVPILVNYLTPLDSTDHHGYLIHDAPDEPRKVDIYFKFFTGDYLRGTLHLTRELHGSYLLLMIAYWDNGGPLPDNNRKLMTIAKCPPSEWPETREVMLDFFQPRDGKWHHKRIDKELAEARKNSESLSQRGKKGAQARWGEDNDPYRLREADSRSMQQPLAEACQSESKSKSESDNKARAKACNLQALAGEEKKAKEVPGENSLMTELRMFLGKAVMERDGGLWRTLIREDQHALRAAILDMQSLEKEGKQWEKSRDAALYDLFQRFKRKR